MSPRWAEPQTPRSPTPTNKVVHKILTFNNGQITHMHAVGSSFTAKLALGRQIVIYIYALDMHQQNINTQWCTYLIPLFSPPIMSMLLGCECSMNCLMY